MVEDYDADAVNRLDHLLVKQGSNRTRKVQAGYQAATTDYAYNERDQLVSETAGGVGTTYGYDANGATTLKSTAGQDATCAWDLRGRLTGVDAPRAEGDGYYEYDTRGVRVLAYAGGVVTGYVIDERNPTGHAKPIEEYEGGAVSKAYVLGHDIIAQASIDAGMEVAYLLKDGHGSTRALLDESGAVMEGQKFEFDAFGDPVGDFAPLTDWLAPDGRTDGETGFTYSLARYRAGWRFMSEDDPAYGSADDPASLHKYLYAHANPVMGSDPSGRFTSIDLSVDGYGASEHTAREAQTFALGSAVFAQVQRNIIWKALQVTISQLVLIVTLDRTSGTVFTSEDGWNVEFTKVNPQTGKLEGDVSTKLPPGITDDQAWKELEKSRIA